MTTARITDTQFLWDQSNISSEGPTGLSRIHADVRAVFPLIHTP